MSEVLGSSEYIQKEISVIQKALVPNCTEKISSKDDFNGSNDHHLVRLQRLRHSAEELELAHDIATYVQHFSSGIGDEFQRYEELTNILCRHPSRGSVFSKLYQEEFLPLHNCTRSNFLLVLRRTLKSSNYPLNCRVLLDQCQHVEQAEGTGSSWSRIVDCCCKLQHVDYLFQRVQSHVEGVSSSSPALDPALREFCRPLVERVKYLFVDEHNTRSGIERLPEWLLNYLRQHALAPEGPYDLLVQSCHQPGGLPPSLALDFLNEIICLAQWVLIDQRQFFRHPSIAGPSSKPMLLCQAIEQLLLFDDFCRNLVNESEKSRLISLVDVCVAGDEELLQWWVARERESVFESLEEVTASGSSISIGSNKTFKTLISPFAEIFCALLRSVKQKASVFSFRGPYLKEVAAPLCEHFVDEVHNAAGDLKKVLTQRKVATEHELRENVLCWMELINGTRMAAATLMSEVSGNDEDDKREVFELTSADQDLSRLGKSLDRLQGVLLEEFVSTFVEILLMERAKLAGYLMRCSHFLSCGHEDVDSVLALTNISPDLNESLWVINIVMDICEKYSVTSIESIAMVDHSTLYLRHYAATMMHTRILSMIAEKLLEVAIDLHGMTPDLNYPGCVIFARDVEMLFGSRMLPHHALRVLDISKFLSLSGSTLNGIGGALCGLVERPPPLTEEVFEADERLFDEAVSMVRAKGFLYLELADVFAVLNRRRDL